MAAEPKKKASPPAGTRRSPRLRDEPSSNTLENTEKKTEQKSPKHAPTKKTVQQTSRASKRSRNVDEHENDGEDELAQDKPMKRVKTPDKKAAATVKDTAAESTVAKDSSSKKDTTSKDTVAKDSSSKDTAAKKTSPENTSSKETSSKDSAAKDTTGKDTVAQITAAEDTAAKDKSFKDAKSDEVTSENVASDISVREKPAKIVTASRSIIDRLRLDSILAADSQAPKSMGKGGPRKSDRAVAAETAKVVPELMKTMPEDFTVCEKLTLENLKPLTRAECPKSKSCKIRVINEDTIEAAIRLNLVKEHNSGHVIVLNMANAYNPGGGWLGGALAQEECIFWRTTLSASLQKKYYPLTKAEGLYTPQVAVIRESRSAGHRRYDPNDGWYPLVSVVSVAAKSRPGVKKVVIDGKTVEVFTNKDERLRAKYNARLCLRMAARKGHRNLVLGALGCGVFGNPRHDTAECWKEVFQEDEFQGGWWDNVTFAVLDRPGGANIKVYTQVLDGLKV